MTKAPAYLWYAQDILLSGRVDSLSAQEECWYRRALDYAWIDGGLSADPAVAALRIKKGCSPKAAQKLMEMFFVPDKKDAAKVVNEKQEILRKKLREKIKKLSKAGKASAAKRTKTKELPPPDEGNKCSTDDEQMSGNSIQFNSINSTKEEKKEETPQDAAKTKRGSRIPDTFFLTSEMRIWGTDRRPDVDLILETEKFCNHWRASTGRNATKMDWMLTWKNWILNAKANGTSQGRNGNGRSTNEDRIAETFDVINQYPTEAELGRFS